MPHAYTEDQLVEQPAIGLFTEQSALPNRYAQLAPPPDAIVAAVDELIRDRPGCRRRM